MMQKKLFFIPFFFLFTLSSIAQSCYQDFSFKSPMYSWEDVFSITLQPDGKIIIGGVFNITHYGIPHYSLDRLNTDGSYDSSFNSMPGAVGNVGILGIVYCTALQPDGKILVGGNFSKYNTTTVDRIIRLNQDGSLDNTFALSGLGPASYPDKYVGALAIQPDGQIIISSHSPGRDLIARLNTNGSIDTSFIINDSISEAKTILVQSDGKIILQHLTLCQYKPNLIERLNPDGSPDPTFNQGGVGVAGGCGLEAAIQQPDGKIIIGGGFTFYNQISQPSIARLNADGSLDASFITGQNIGGVTALALQSDGKIIVAGSFASRSIARLNTDGSLDASFYPVQSSYANNGGSGPFNTTSGFFSVVVQPDQKILIGCNFRYTCLDSSYQSGSNSVVRLMPDGVNAIQDMAANLSAMVKLMPNPFSQNTVLTVDGLEQYENLQLGIYDITGQQVRMFATPNTSSFEIERNGLPQGIYFYNLKQNGKGIANGKMVIQD